MVKDPPEPMNFLVARSRIPRIQQGPISIGFVKILDPVDPSRSRILWIRQDPGSCGSLMIPDPSRSRILWIRQDPRSCGSVKIPDPVSFGSRNLLGYWSCLPYTSHAEQLFHKHLALCLWCWLLTGGVCSPAAVPRPPPDPPAGLVI